MLVPAKPTNEQARLQALHALNLLDTPPEECFERITRIAKHMFGCKTVLLCLVDADRQWIKSQQGLVSWDSRREVSFCAHAILEDEALHVTDTHADPRFAANPLVTKQPGVRFYAGMPIKSPSGYKIGTLCLIDDQPRELTRQELQTLADLGHVIESELAGRERGETAVSLDSIETEKATKEDMPPLGNTQLQFNAFLGGSDAFIVILDYAGRIVQLNAAAEKITGYAFDEIINRYFWDIFIPPEEHTKIIRIFRNIQQGEIISRFKTYLVKGDGSARLFDCTSSVIMGEDGKIKFIIFGGWDTNDQSGSKKALEESNKRLINTENTLRQILDNAPIGIWLQNSDGKLLFVNKTFCDAVGISEEQFTSVKHYAELYPPEIAASCMLSDKEALQQSVPHVSFERIPFTDGKIHDLEIVKVRLLDQQQHTSGLIGISTDITERKRIERMKKEFVSTVSHELRTPLTAINGAIKLLEGGVLGELPEIAKNMISIAQNNSLRLENLINDLLDMEKLENGKVKFNIQEFDLTEQVEQAITDNQGYAEQLGIQLVLTTKINQLIVNVDAQRLHQVLGNLISNAAKFSPKGEKVEISINRNDDKACVSIRDQGPGIPEDFHDRIFEKFAQADASDSRQKGGTGLGLAISRQLIHAMHGQIGFESTPGHGSTFYFELPVNKISNSEK